MQNKLRMEVLGGKQSEFGTFEELKSNRDWFGEEK